MSDHSISIVPRQSSYPNNITKAKEILDWLISKDIIKPTLSDCTLGSDNGYAVSEGAKKVTTRPDDLPYDIITNGLSIITERQVFDTGENFIDKLTCPSCNENIAFDDWDLNPWSNKESDNLTCPQCGHETEIHNYKFEPEWGYSDLGFTFWNWPDFKDDFIDEFRNKLDCEISIVNQHI
jgi:Zn ribbon nucleic-acid-binding protein